MIRVVILIFIHVYSILLAQNLDSVSEVMNWDETIAVSDIDLFRVDRGESNLTNLVCDIMLKRTDADFAFINQDDIFSDIPVGAISHLDLFRLCPFGRTLVLLEINGEQLKQLIESKIRGIRRGLAIGGGKVEYDTSRTNFNRLTYFQIGDHSFYPKKVYRVITTNYIAEGNAGFELLTHLDESNIIHTGILLRQALREYLVLNSPINVFDVRIDGRWLIK